MTGVDLTASDLAACERIKSKIPGYSTAAHYAFFKGVLQQFTWVHNILVLGVYHGRDIAFILDCANSGFTDRRLKVIGVDKFEDAACADWPTEKRAMNWRDAGFGVAPAAPETVCVNIVEAVGYPMKDELGFTVVENDDADFLGTTESKFDFIYLDTSHDYETVMRQLRQVGRICSSEKTIIAGDDLSNAGTWGVQRAVSEGFTSYEVFGGWIWISDKERLKL